MFEFKYLQAKTLSEAAAFVAANPDAKLLAGGMTLIPTLKQRLAQPSHLVDIGGLPELRGIEVKEGKLVPEVFGNEDLVVVTKNGCDRLPYFRKDVRTLPYQGSLL